MMEHSVVSAQQQLMFHWGVDAFPKSFGCSVTGQEVFKLSLGVGEFMMLLF